MRVFFVVVLAVLATAVVAVNGQATVLTSDCRYFCPRCDMSRGFSSCPCCYDYFNGCAFDKCSPARPMPKPGKDSEYAAEVPEDLEEPTINVTKIGGDGDQCRAFLNCHGCLVNNCGWCTGFDGSTTCRAEMTKESGCAAWSRSGVTDAKDRKADILRQCSAPKPIYKDMKSNLPNGKISPMIDDPPAGFVVEDGDDDDDDQAGSGGHMMKPEFKPASTNAPAGPFFNAPAEDDDAEDYMAPEIEDAPKAPSIIPCSDACKSDAPEAVDGVVIVDQSEVDKADAAGEEEGIEFTGEMGAAKPVDTMEFDSDKVPEDDQKDNPDTEITAMLQKKKLLRKRKKTRSSKH